MESLNASTLSVVLKIREGTGFGFLTSPFVIVCSLNGNALTSDPIPCSPNPTFESDFVWEAEKKVLRSMRSHNFSIRVECFSDAKFRRSDKIGYILLNMKHQAQIVSSAQVSNVKFNWHKLLGVGNQAKSYKPEVYLSLFITEADAEIQLKTPKSVLPDATANKEEPELKESEKVAEQPMDLNSGKVPVQIGSPRENDVNFKLTIKLTSLDSLASLVGKSSEDNRIEFALFGQCFKTNNLSLGSEGNDNECIALCIKCQLHSLVAYFSEFPNIHFLLQASGQIVAKAPYDMRSFITQDKCESLVSGKEKIISQDGKLNLDTADGETECNFTITLSLEVEKTKVKNPIKPFTVSTNSKKIDKSEDKSGGSKIRGISCKTKTNTASPREEKAASQPVKEPQIKPPCTQVEDINPASNETKPNQMTDECLQECTKNSVDIYPPQFNAQGMPQFVYPYFQPNFPFPQDGRGDSCDIIGMQHPGLAEKVKAKITEDLARKTLEELEEWKDKQKESYKAELKKKLDKEVKRLTNEWLSRQNELEREATTNIEESVTLSHQLHSTSAELKVRLESVTKQQEELEKEREVLDKKYSEKHLELKETSKKHISNLQQQITSLRTEMEELKAKNCSLLRENDLLRCGHPMAGSNDSQPASHPLNKPAHLTDQQMTTLLVDMKSLEEKLSAALESKEFFRKEWSRALREIHRMKTEQEEQVRLQLQAQRQELDNLRLVGLITADEKASKEDMASLRDIRSQIVRLNTPKSG